MINPSIIIRGKTWGHRLQRRLSRAPVGMAPWLRRHTKPIKDEPKRYIGHYFMRDMSCYLKVYRRRFFLHVIPSLLRMGKPVKTFKTAMHLAASGVPVPRPLTCVMVADGVIVLSEGLYSGGGYTELWRAGQSQDTVRDMMKGAAVSLAAAHMAGYIHGACDWCNLLWSEGDCYLVELEGVRRRRFRVEEHRARDIARFSVGAEEEGVALPILEIFLEEYARLMSTDRDTLVERMQPQLERIRREREEHHGIAPRPLL